MNHSSGPWTHSKELNRRWIEGAAGFVIADQIATRADAVLIAAAPELVTALRKVTDQLIVFIRADGSHEPHMNEAVFEAEALLKRIDEGGNDGT